MKRIIAEINDKLHEQIRKFAFNNKITIKQIVINALEKYFEGVKK